MSNYSKDLMSQLENSSREDIHFKKYCEELCERITRFQTNLDTCKNSLLQDSLNMTSSKTYKSNKGIVTRYGYVSYRIREDIKKQVNSLNEYLKIFLKD